MVAVQNILERDALHFVFGRSLHPVKRILKRQLNIDPHTAFRVGMGIQMEQGFLAFYR